MIGPTVNFTDSVEDTLGLEAREKLGGAFFGRAFCNRCWPLPAVPRRQEISDDFFLATQRKATQVTRKSSTGSTATEENFGFGAFAVGVCIMSSSSISSSFRRESSCLAFFAEERVTIGSTRASGGGVGSHARARVTIGKIASRS